MATNRTEAKSTGIPIWRASILSLLADAYDLKTYLEIGVRRKETFRAVRGPIVKHSVDPDPACQASFVMTSDEFFAKNRHRYDLIFIDGAHESEFVGRDIENALACLNPGGAIVCHDCSPPAERHQEVPRTNYHETCWCGDGWKAFVRTRAAHPELEMYVVDADLGCGVIRESLLPQPPFAVAEADLTWENFAVHRREWLNLISPAAFCQKLARDMLRREVEKERPLTRDEAAALGMRWL